MSGHTEHDWADEGYSIHDLHDPCDKTCGPQTHLQWAPSGNMLDGIPSEMSRFLASADGKTRGYGWGPGASIIFGTEHGDITLLPGQWVTRYEDGTFTVSGSNAELSRGTGS